jgi:hypothetical protein
MSEDEEEEDDDDDGDITQEPWYEGSVQRGALPLFTSSGVMRGQEGDSGQEFFLLQLPQGLPQCVDKMASKDYDGRGGRGQEERMETHCGSP